MTSDFYAKRRRRLLVHIAYLRGKYPIEQCSRRIAVMRTELGLLRREYHGGEQLAWAPLSLDYSEGLKTLKTGAYRVGSVFMRGNLVMKERVEPYLHRQQKRQADARSQEEN